MQGKRNQGFTVLELAIAVALLVTFVAIAIPTYQRIQTGAWDKAARLTLLSVEPELARIQSESLDGTFPDDLAPRVQVGSTEVVTADRSDGDVSLGNLDGEYAIGTTMSRSGTCWAAFFNITDEPLWAFAKDILSTQCTADNPLFTIGAPTSGPGSTTDLTPDLPAPEQPTSVVAVAGDGQVTLNWTLPTTLRLTDVTVYQGTSNSFAAATALPLQNRRASSHTFTGLTNGSTYHYWVTATSTGGEGPASAAVTATPLPPAPGAPTNVSLTVTGNGDLAVTWVRPVGVVPVVSYRVWVGVTPVQGIAVASQAVTGTSYTATGLDSAYTQYVWVTATNLGGEGEPSAPASSTLPKYAAGIRSQSSLRGYWRLGETSGTTAAGEAYGSPAPARNGTYVGSPTLGEAGALQGDPNTAVAFSGAQSVTLPTSPSYTWNFASNETKSVELWVKTTDSSGPIFSARSSNGNGVFGLYVGSDGVTGAVGGAGDGKLRFLVRSDNNTGETEIVSLMTINDGNWHHIAAVYRNKTMELYVDGAKMGTTLTATSWTGNLTANKVALGTDRYWVDSNVGGVSEDQRYLTGSVDELATYFSGHSLLPFFAGHALLGLNIPSGGVVSSGRAADGRLGNGILANHFSYSYGHVRGLIGATDIAAGTTTACAVASGAAYCWGAAGVTGDGSNGLIGNGTSQGASTPQQVVGLTSNVTAISVGQYVACAIRSGAVLCWGENGRTGTGSTGGPFLMAPVASTITSGATHIAAGSTGTCAIVGDQVLCWGPNAKGQMGNNTISHRTFTPTAVQGLPAGTPTAISVGYEYACAVVNGAAYCWGNQEDGRLGNNTTAAGTVLTAQPVPAMSSGVTAIAGKSTTTCAIKTGEVWCWGENAYYQLGLGAAAGTADTGVPIRPEGLPSSGARTLDMWNAALVGYENGEIWGWGHNHDGRLGYGGVAVEFDKSPIRIDTRVPSLAGAQKVALAGGSSYWVK